MEQVNEANPVSLNEDLGSVRYIGRHKKCGYVTAVDCPRRAATIRRTVYVYGQGHVYRDQVTTKHDAPKCKPCPCGAGYISWSRVDGVVSEKHTCDARCTNAIGPSCECSCGGKNHGKGWVGK